MHSSKQTACAPKQVSSSFSRGPDARAVRAALTDARTLCAALGLLEGHQRQAGGVIIRCPAHLDQTPSCSVRRAADGTLSAACFACGWTGDALTLVALARGLDLRSDFPAVVAAAAAVAQGIVPLDAPGPARGPGPALAYPPTPSVAALWHASMPPDRVDSSAGAYLAGRSIDPDMVALYDLARELPTNAPCPPWARVRGRTWSEGGYRLVVPMVDHTGELRSLRAWRIDGDTEHDQAGERPKRVAPAGHLTAGLVMACPLAQQMLRTGAAPDYFKGRPLDVVVVEGEPDFLTWAARVSDSADRPPAVLGVVSAAWSEAVAARIPDGSRVFIRTHRDSTGDRYAAAIRDSLNERLVAVFDFDRTSSEVSDGQAA